MMLDISREKITKDKLVYLNVNPQTHSMRKAIIDKFKDKSYVTYEQPTNTMIGRKDFLRKIKQHSFVICPRENGIDTHRLYETLYMGSIPITEYNDIHASLLDLPILFITDWNIITEEYLINKLKEMKTRKYNMNKLYTKYWFNLMLNKIKS